MTKRLQGGFEIVTDDAAGLIQPSHHAVAGRPTRILSFKSLENPGRFSASAQARAMDLFRDPGVGASSDIPRQV